MYWMNIKRFQAGRSALGGDTMLSWSRVYRPTAGCKVGVMNKRLGDDKQVKFQEESQFSRHDVTATNVHTAGQFLMCHTRSAN